MCIYPEFLNFACIHADETVAKGFEAGLLVMINPALVELLFLH